MMNVTRTTKLIFAWTLLVMCTAACGQSQDSHTQPNNPCTASPGGEIQAGNTNGRSRIDTLKQRIRSAEGGNQDSASPTGRTSLHRHGQEPSTWIRTGEVRTAAISAITGGFAPRTRLVHLCCGATIRTPIHVCRFGSYESFVRFHDGWSMGWRLNSGWTFGSSNARTSAPTQPIVASMPIYGARDESLLAMSEGRAQDAITILTALAIREPADADVLRRLAVAHAASGNVKGAAQTMMRAYTLDAGLCTSPMNAKSYGLSATRWRRLILDTVSTGHKSNRPDLWFLAATLMQAEGRPGPAKRMMDRAIDSGIEGDLGRRMQAAL